MKPLGRRIVTKPIEKDEKTSFGLILPNAKDGGDKSHVLVVSVSDEVTELKQGDECIVKSWGGDEVEVDGEMCRVFSIDDVLAVVNL